MARLLLALETRSYPHSAAPYFERFRTIITPGTMISGGISINIVPDHCEALVDIRTTPEHDAATIEALFDTLIAALPGYRFSYERLNEIPAVCSDPTAPIFAILAEVTGAVRGVTPTMTVAGPANEGYLLIAQGIPTVCGFGPTGENAHAVDEYADVPSLLEAAQIFALTARRLSFADAQEG
jgi:acetylornithine deacetylase/succinyl-diaminopimelate desuccinylase-like protein